MSAPIRIAIQRLPHGEGLPLPAYATTGAAGMDVVATMRDPARDAELRSAAEAAGVTLTCATGDGEVRVDGSYVVACPGARADALRTALGVAFAPVAVAAHQLRRDQRCAGAGERAARRRTPAVLQGRLRRGAVPGSSAGGDCMS